MVRPHLTPRALLGRLSSGNQLDELRLGELNVRARIASGYWQLGTIERRLLNCLVASGLRVFDTNDLADAIGDVALFDETPWDTLTDSHMLSVERPPTSGDAWFRLNDFDQLFVQEILTRCGQTIRRPVLRRRALDARRPLAAGPGASHQDVGGMTRQLLRCTPQAVRRAMRSIAAAG